MRIAPLIRIGVTGAALALLCWRVPFAVLAGTLREIQVRWLWPALAAVLLMLGVRSLRWHRLLAAGDIRVTGADSTRSMFGGFALSVILPGRFGELGRCLFLPRAHRAQVLLLNILDRALDCWALFTWGVVSAFLVAPRPAAVFAVGVWLAVLPLLLGLPRLASRLVGELPCWGTTFRPQLRAAKCSLVAVPTARFAGLALVSTTLDLVVFYCLLGAFHEGNFRAAVATFPWIVMAGGLPLSVSGLGPREGVAALLLAEFAVPPAAALEATLLWFAFSSLLPGLLGGAWLLAGGLQPLRANWPRNVETLVDHA